MKKIYTKNQFIKIISQLVDLTPQQCENALSKVTIGADGISIALTINWLKSVGKKKQLRNKLSNWLLIIYLKSEMRWYADLGSASPFVSIICNRFYECQLEKLSK